MSNTVRNWLGIAGVCLVFVFGMVAGAALTIQVERAHAETVFASGHLGDMLTERLTRRLTTQLRCDPRQREEVHDILLDAQRDMREARRQIAPQLRQVFLRSAERVRDILRGDQVKTFDEIMERIRARQGPAETAPSVMVVEPSPTVSPPKVPETGPPSR